MGAYEQGVAVTMQFYRSQGLRNQEAVQSVKS
ncbi:integrase domain-containing protein [Proteus mirabilis]|nr:integrase domain-containing protein [Proteus mirabilis]